MITRMLDEAARRLYISLCRHLLILLDSHTSRNKMVLPNDVDLLNPQLMPGLFQHNNRIQPLSNGGGMWKLPDGVVPSECKTH
uniref:Uncharacterized protein n=1 Tax=Lactuca sativa TaxID=4236 RepID=A0A9R1XDG8_LACSA|nr:hypothetical protein LSAT_V11C400217640 [Lactuca sativa]